MSGEIVVNVLVRVAPGREAEFLEVMRVDAIESRKEPGCSCFHVSRSTDERTYMFYEVYADASAVEHHKRTPHYKRWNDFRESGGIEKQHNTVCEGVYVGAVPPSSASSSPGARSASPGAPGSAPSSGGGAKHGGNNYDVSMEPPRRGHSTPPSGFGHPRGFAEEPIRPGTLSNFGRGGVRHVRKGGVSVGKDTLAFYEGGLAPSHGPVKFGHESIQNHDEGKGKDNTRKIAMESRTNFNGCGPLPDDGSEAPRRRPSLDGPRNFDGMRLADDAADEYSPERRRRLPGQEHPWSAQLETRDHFDGMGLKKWDGRGHNPDQPIRTPDPHHPWSHQSNVTANFDGMSLTSSPNKESPPPRTTTAPFDNAHEHGHVDPHNFPGGHVPSKRRPAAGIAYQGAGSPSGGSSPGSNGSPGRPGLVAGRDAAGASRKASPTIRRGGERI